MAGTSRTKRKWLTPSRDGKGSGRLAGRYCRVCGAPASSVRIMKALNLCSVCAAKFRAERDGKWACRGCGKVAPAQLERNQGYCEDCVCPACKRPDPAGVRRLGLCERCAAAAHTICRGCGREAPAQVKRNAGLCDACAQKGKQGGS